MEVYRNIVVIWCLGFGRLAIVVFGSWRNIGSCLVSSLVVVSSRLRVRVLSSCCIIFAYWLISGCMVIALRTLVSVDYRWLVSRIALGVSICANRASSYESQTNQD